MTVAGTIPVVVQDMPPTIKGFCTLGSDYEPLIVLNSRLPREQQQETYLHELSHILRGEMYDEEYKEYE